MTLAHENDPGGIMEEAFSTYFPLFVDKRRRAPSRRVRGGTGRLLKGQLHRLPPVVPARPPSDSSKAPSRLLR